MANPLSLTVTAVAVNGARALPAADVIDTTGVVPILAADTDGEPERLVMEITSKGFGQSVTVMPGNNPPAVRAGLGPYIRAMNAVRASLATAFGVVNAELVFTAVDGGDAGNGITVELIDPAGANPAESVAVVGSAIAVTLAHDGANITSTAAAVIAAIAAEPAAAALIAAASAAGNDGTGLVPALVATPLAGGADLTEVFGPFLSDRFEQANGDMNMLFTVAGAGTFEVRTYRLPRRL